MKSTEVQTLGELRMRDTANWWTGHVFTRGLLQKLVESLTQAIYWGR